MRKTRVKALKAARRTLYFNAVKRAYVAARRQRTFGTNREGAAVTLPPRRKRLPGATTGTWQAAERARITALNRQAHGQALV